MADISRNRWFDVSELTSIHDSVAAAAAEVVAILCNHFDITCE